MSNLFDNTQLQKILSANIQNMSSQKSEIFTRWHALLSTTSKNEEQLQTDFLNDIFGDVLGYTYKRGEAETNLEKEEKTELDGQKPDGILGFFNEKGKDVRVVIELKDQKTDIDKKQNRATDKRSPVEQAFGYVSKYQGVEWVIVSNFKEIRLYKAGYAGKYHSFTMEELANSLEKQHEFHFLLAKDRLFTKKPNQSPVHSLDTTEKGEEIEKRFYKHYSTLREEIWHNLLALNAEKHYGRNFYLYKAQKLIDRIIFIRFCKENGALDNDAVLEALNNKFVPGKYNRLKFLFQAMDGGNPEIGIARFNGGLFATDGDLDNLQVSDDIIDKIVILYAHDFGSDLDVNILGHIFEQSISDLENLTGDNEKKRKKDGVFYTPAYITEYIVREAVGGWLADRKAEIKAKENSKEWWQQYADKLKSIKVLDPACGSGAFLVKVFDYLQNEWREVQKHIKTEPTVGGSHWNYKDILTHNIYGVDINPASTGITKLSLWLKTAHYREPLTTLDGNIKIGNSLIDNPDIAGYYSEFEGKVIQEVIAKDLFNASDLEKLTAEGVKKSLAFKWSEEFKEVFDAGGFDVVVGNPPYVFARGNISQDIKDYYVSKYKSAQYQVNTYLLFIEQALKLVSNGGSFGLIVPNAWLMVQSAQNLRALLLKECAIKNIVNLLGYSFDGVNVETIIIHASKAQKPNNAINILEKAGESFVQSSTINQSIFQENEDKAFKIFINDNNNILLGKIQHDTLALSDIANVKAGLKAYESGKGIPKQTAEDVTNRIYDYTHKFDESTHRYLEGKDVLRYGLDWGGTWLKYGNNLASPRTFDLFDGKKIIVREITGQYPKSIIATYSEDVYLFNMSNIAVLPKEGSDYDLRYILAVLGSSVISYYFRLNTPKSVRQMFPKIILQDLAKFPIKKASQKDQQPLITHAQKMLDLTRELNEQNTTMFELLAGDFPKIKINNKLKKWSELSWGEFLSAITSQKITMTDEQEEKWLKRFKRLSAEAIIVRENITRTDAEIDKMVYALYGLSEEEIGVVEGIQLIV